MPTSENLLVSAVLIHRSRDILGKNNFGPENMTRFKDELFFILNAKQSPSVQTFNAKFKKFRVRKVPVGDIPTLIESCRQRKIKQDGVLLLRQGITAITNGELPEKVLIDLENKARKINTQFTNTTDIDVLDDINRYIDIYSEKRKKFKTGESIGIPYGLPTADSLIGGMLPGDLITIASRLGVGKSFIMCKMCASALVNGYDSLYLSLEMNWDDIASRIFTILSHDLQRGDAKLTRILMNSDINLGKISMKKMATILSHIKKQIKGKLWVPDIQGKFSIANAGRKIEQLSPDLALFDYFGLATSESGKVENWMQAADSSNLAKIIARTHHIPFVMGAQLNRAGAGQPGLQHIAITDAIGQDSDRAFVLTEKNNRLLQLHCQKNRGGKDGWRLLLNWNVNSGIITERRAIMGDANSDEEDDE